MAYSASNLPLTGAGDATAAVATDLIGGQSYQLVKLFDGAEGSTLPIIAKETTPGSTDAGVVVRSIGSTAFSQAVVGAVGLTSGSSQVGLTSGSSAVELTSAGSTRLAGRFTIDNPTTAVTVDGTVNLSSVGSTRVVGLVGLSSQITVSASGTTTVDANLTSAGSTRSVGTVNQGSPAGTSADAWWVRTVSSGSAGGSTTVDLGSGGSTKLVGTVGQAAGSTSIAPWYVISTAPTGGPGSSAVDANLTSEGSTRVVGIVDLATSTGIKGAVSLATAGTTATLGQVALSSGSILGAGSSANTLGSVALVAGTTANALGSVAILAGGSTIGSVQQGAGSSGNFWFMQSIPFSSANRARTTVNTSVDASVIAANANRKALIIQNLTTVDVALGLSTVAVTTALAANEIVLSGRNVAGGGGRVVFGPYADVPLFTGPIRGITIGSTAISGGVSVTEFT